MCRNLYIHIRFPGTLDYETSLQVVLGQCRVIRIPQGGQTTDDKQVPDSLLGFELVLFGELVIVDTGDLVHT